MRGLAILVIAIVALSAIHTQQRELVLRATTAMPAVNIP